ncbi:glycosyl hydrolase family 2, sugar binding domain protein [Dictyocaulus viviparus]|uniref:Glycosyl hydrolase family 2, sugar binding domain protein n=1 Tax=Dictyocaulus viviparus TaxID=29172 RepID=A0A0D8Y139_DICVI|nr:glycosyl hydrolase family 2, sugar binding domain protein [Dictyocaulus viviparus]
MEQTNSNDVGLRKLWYTMDLAKFPNATIMPVPSAYNDLSASAELRDHIGWVWYQTTIFVPKRDIGQRMILRFSSVNYYAKVYFNSKEIGSHIGGHLPFQFDITSSIIFGSENKITVAVNNTLSWKTIPQGDFYYMKATTRNIAGKNVRNTNLSETYTESKGLSSAKLQIPQRILLKVMQRYSELESRSTTKRTFFLLSSAETSTATIQKHERRQSHGGE